MFFFHSTFTAFQTENILKYYEIRNTDIIRDKGVISVFTRVPLVNPDHNSILIPINPTKRLENQDNNNFIIKNLKHAYYNVIRYDELHMFQYVKQLGYLSSLRHVEIHMHETTNPEENFKNIQVERIINNGYMVYLRKEMTGQIYCRGNNTKIKMTGETYIQIPNHCSLSSPRLKINTNMQTGIIETKYVDNVYIKDLKFMQIKKTETKLSPKLKFSTHRIQNNIIHPKQKREISTIDIATPIIAAMALTISLATLAIVVIKLVFKQKEVSREDFEMTDIKMEKEEDLKEKMTKLEKQMEENENRRMGITIEHN